MKTSLGWALIIVPILTIYIFFGLKTGFLHISLIFVAAALFAASVVYGLYLINDKQ